MEWILSIAKSQFFVVSYLTFHEAALKDIRQQLVKYLSFIIFHLDEDGVIMCQSDEELFDRAKRFFKKHFEQNYVHNSNQDIYYPMTNFDKIRFPLARIIHQEFIKLRSQYLKILREQNQQLNLQINKDINKQKETLVKLSPEERAKFFEQERYQRTLLKDKELDQNIESVKEWCLIYCPDEEFKELLDIGNDIYLNDFSYLLLQQILSNEGKKSDDSNKLQRSYQMFIKESLLMLMKERLESKAHIYGIYWKCENLLNMVWKIVGNNIDRAHSFFKIEAFIEKLRQLVRSHHQYTD